MESNHKNFTYEPNDLLEHYGVLGMKWGRRKDRSSSSSSKKPSKRTVKKQAKEKVVNEKFGKHLDDKELQKRINRLSKEEQYYRLLTTQERTKANALKSNGRKRIERLVDYVFWGSLEAAGRNEMYNFMMSPGKELRKKR